MPPAAGDVVMGAGGVTGAGDRDGASSGGWSRASSTIAAKLEGRGGGGDLGLQCGNDEGQRKSLDAGLLFLQQDRRCCAASGQDGRVCPIIIVRYCLVPDVHCSCLPRSPVPFHHAFVFPFDHRFVNRGQQVAFSGSVLLC
jgi:hypothetical protein